MKEKDNKGTKMKNTITMLINKTEIGDRQVTYLKVPFQKVPGSVALSQNYLPLSFLDLRWQTKRPQ